VRHPPVAPVVVDQGRGTLVNYWKYQKTDQGWQTCRKYSDYPVFYCQSVAETTENASAM